MGNRTLRSAASALATAFVAAWLALAPASWAPPAARTPAARADSLTYSETRRQFKVGILLIDSTTVAARPGAGAENPDPFVFYVADSRGDVKPQNWELVNPLAPSTVTADVFNRWSADANNNGIADQPLDGRDPGHPYKIGQKVTKNMAAYWEVSLSKATESDLLQYDLLFITNHRLSRMTPAESEKLRRVVDAGAVVWLEDCGNMRIDPTGRFFLSQIQFHGTQAGLGVMGDGLSGPVVYAPAHPILNAPFQLSYQEIANLGDKNYGDFYLRTLNDTASTSGDPEDTTNTAPNKETLVTVVGNGYRNDVNVTNKALPYIAAGSYGSGAVVVTAGDSGCDINDYTGGFNVGSGGNSGAYCGPNISSAHTEDLKFVYNLIAWGSGGTTARRNNRRSAATFAGANAPLVNNFDVPAAGTDPLVPSFSGAVGINSLTPPLIRNGIMYVSGVDAGGAGTVTAYDIQPLRDFDGDGNPDDGRQDLILGQPYDELWRITVGGGQPSAPVFATLSLAGGGQQDAILVTLSDGTLAALNALPIVGGRVSQNGVLVGSNATTASGIYGGFSGNSIPPAPVFFENKIYVVEPTGKVRCVWGGNVGGAYAWISSAVTNLPTILPIGNPAMAVNRLNVRGTLSDNSNGGTGDITLYVPAEETPSTGGGNPQGRIYAYWTGTRNEVMKDIQNDGTVRTRIASGAELNKYFMAKGVAAGQPWAITPRVTIYTDTIVGGIVTRTREENYAAGLPNLNFDAVLQDATNPDYYNGVLQIRKAGSNFDPRAAGVEKILVAIDYDVVYVPPTGDPPQLLQGATGQTGARTARPLGIQNYVPNPAPGGPVSTPLPSLDSLAVAADNLLLFGANQQQAGLSVTNPPTFGSIYAVSEQEFSPNASRLRWRFSLHPGTTGQYTDDGLRTIEVDGMSLAEAPALRNRLVFDPANDAAAVLNVAPYFEALRHVRVFGSPVVSNDGLTYVLASAASARNGGANADAQNVTVLMAFKTNPDIVLTLPEAFDAQRPVTLSQADLLTYDDTNGTAQQTTSFTFQGTGDGAQAIADPSRGKITMVGFQNPGGGGQFSASESFVVRYTPAGASQEKRVVISPFPSILGNTNGTGDPNVTNQTTDLTGGNARQGSGGFSPLQWYYVLPGRPLSSPTLNGDTLYFNQLDAATGATNVVAVDANPGANDPTVRIGSGEQIFNVVTSIQQIGSATPTATTVNHVRSRQRLAPAGVVPTQTAPPVGGEGTLAVATSSAGVAVYQENATLIAESKRILEVDGDGAAIWAVNSTVDNHIAGGSSPVYNGTGGTIIDPNATGRGLLDRKELNRPQAVRKLGGSDYLIADTGNNRVVRIDRAAKVQFECASVTDPNKLLDSGDPLTLNNPTDVFYYPYITYDLSDPMNPIITGREDHYIIADSGNNRIIEVANFYDNRNRIRTNLTNYNPGNPSLTARGERVVVWVSRTGSREGRSLRFQNIQRYVDGLNGGGKPYLTAVISNTTAAGVGSSVASDFTGGSVVELNYQPYNVPYVNAANAVQTPWPAPTGTNTPRDTEPKGDGLVTVAISDLWLRQAGGPPAGRLKRITRPSFFERIILPLRPTAGGTLNLHPVYMIADSEGVYACTTRYYPADVDPIDNPAFVPGPNDRLVMVPLWKLDQVDYNRMNGVGPGGVLSALPAATRLNVGAGPLTAAQYATLPAFTPASIRRLPNGNFLITNSAVGASPWFTNGQFYGETFEVTPFDAAGNPFNTAGAQFLTTITAAGGDFAGFSAPLMQRLPTGTGSAFNVQKMGRRDNTGVTEQPTSSDRL